MNNKNSEKEIFEKALNRALFFLKFRPRSEKEVRDYLILFLHKKKISLEIQEKIIKTVISRLKELNFVNDRDFVSFWIGRRFRTNPKGQKIIIQELRLKGIPKEIIEDTLEKEFNKYSKRDIIQRLLEKADKRYHNLPERLRKQKLINYIFTRGFSFSEARWAVDELIKEK